MKLGPVTKLDKTNMTTSNLRQYDFKLNRILSENFFLLIFLNLLSLFSKFSFWVNSLELSRFF